MIRHLQMMVDAHRAKQHERAAEFAARAAKEFEGTPIGDYAGSLAAQECRRALHADARTHIGRMARG